MSERLIKGQILSQCFKDISIYIEIQPRNYGKYLLWQTNIQQNIKGTKI